MPTKIKKLVDSNVLVYAYDKNSIFHQKATAFLSNPAFEFYVSTKNISEYFSVLSKFGEPFAKAFQFYQSIKSNAIVLYPDHNSLPLFETLMDKYQPVGN